LSKAALLAADAKLNYRTPEIAFDRGVPFDGFVHGKVSDRVVSLYKYSVCVNVHSAPRDGRGGLCQDDHAFGLRDGRWIEEQVPGQAGGTDKNGNRNGCDEN